MKNKLRLLACLVICLSFLFAPVAAYASGSGGGGGGGGNITLESSTVNNGDTNVPVAVVMTFTFSNNVIDSGNKENNANCFTLKDAQGNVVPINVIMADEQLEPDLKNDIGIEPAEPLQAGKTYTLTIDKGVKAKNGNTLAADIVITFTTAGGGGGGGGGNNNPLTLENSTVRNGDTNVPLDQEFTFEFARNVIAFALRENNTNCFSLRDAEGNAVPIKIIMADEQLESHLRNFISLEPEVALLPGKTYTITISKELTANNGNTLGSDITITFTTADGSGNGGNGGGNNEEEKDPKNNTWLWITLAVVGVAILAFAFVLLKRPGKK
ncbi:MAG: Ig-like domain-containing protein [Clostridiales bacterium]|nr:Ig-like domain-containing protein [Clostridiales bacterium]